MRKLILSISVLSMSFSVFAQDKVLTGANGKSDFVYKNGNVGIGTNNPGSKLNIIGSHYDTQLLLHSSGGGTDATYADLSLWASEPGRSFTAVGIGNNIINKRTEPFVSRINNNRGGSYMRLLNGFIHFNVVNANGIDKRAMVIETNGNVGIGTTSPAAKFHILQNQENYDSGIKIVGSSSPISGRIWMKDEKFHIDNATGGAESGLTFDKEGKIGVGTNTPYTKFDIAGVTFLRSASGHEVVAEQLRIGRSDGNIRYHSVYSYHSSTQSANYMQFRIHSGGGAPHLSQNTVMTMFGDGNVGIGTTDTKGFKLAVKGKIGAAEIQVKPESTWPDFVFAPEYKLRSLTEVESFIQENKHLPEIPSEAEVAEEGIAVGEMNAKLLQKIEELTLYVIEQNKTIEVQSSKLEVQSQEIQDIKAKNQELELQNAELLELKKEIKLIKEFLKK